MSYIAILTHNPQDYFEGYEDEELTMTLPLFKHDYFQYHKLLNHIDNGYKAIILKVEDSRDELSIQA